MRVGYSFWGYLGDFKYGKAGNEVSTPDGNATYSWSIIHELNRRGHLVYSMQQDRDWPGWRKHRETLFGAFAAKERNEAYDCLRHTCGSEFQLPELDVLLLEWRWPIPGRNMDEVKTDRGVMSRIDSEHQPDWGRQIGLLNHYKGKRTKIIIWDLDHKLTSVDEDVWKPDAIFETSSRPLELTMVRTKVEPPILIKSLSEFPTFPQEPTRKLVYIGSRYERDDVIDEWIKPVSDGFPGEIEFHGKWNDEAKARWPNIKMEQRCTVTDFRRIYSSACSVPLLAKKSYLESGFITPRIWEALLFGSIPVGLSSMFGVENYLPKSLIVKDPDNLAEVVKWLSLIGNPERDEIRRSVIEKLEFMDAKYFVNKIESVL